MDTPSGCSRTAPRWHPLSVPLMRLSVPLMRLRRMVRSALTSLNQKAPQACLPTPSCSPRSPTRSPNSACWTSPARWWGKASTASRRYSSTRRTSSKRQPSRADTQSDCSRTAWICLPLWRRRPTSSSASTPNPPPTMPHSTLTPNHASMTPLRPHLQRIRKHRLVSTTRSRLRRRLPPQRWHPSAAGKAAIASARGRPWPAPPSAKATCASRATKASHRLPHRAKSARCTAQDRSSLQQWPPGFHKRHPWQSRTRSSKKRRSRLLQKS